MKNLIIVGAGGFGREVYGYAQDMPECGREWQLKGFLDDNPQALEGVDDIRHPILSPIREYHPTSDDLFANGIGQPGIRKELVNIVLSKGAVFTNLIHPSVYIGRNVKMGTGCVLAPNVVLTADALIGDHVCLNVGTCIGHDARLGNYIQTSNLCDITGYVSIKEGVSMGSRSTILPSLTVGEWAKVGPGSIVVNNVDPHTTVMGNPAKRLPAS